MEQRFIVEPGFDRRQRKCFYVKDSLGRSSNVVGVNEPLRSKTEADYLAWVLNSRASNQEDENAG